MIQWVSHLVLRVVSVSKRVQLVPSCLLQLLMQFRLVIMAVWFLIVRLNLYVPFVVLGLLCRA